MPGSVTNAKGQEDNWYAKLAHTTKRDPIQDFSKRALFLVQLGQLTIILFNAGSSFVTVLF